MAATLTATGVAKRYGSVAALADVSFEVDAGRVMALIGANGAGKSTLIKCILGLVRFDGCVSVAGLDVCRSGKQVRRQVGYMPQHPAFHPDLTVRETAVFYSDLKGASHEQARELVEEMGLAEHAEKVAGALSGGMQQRLALAIALLGDPALLVLDEPAAGLDVAARLELRRLVHEQRRLGRAVLLSTHWLEDVPYVADDVIELERGRLVRSMPAADLVAVAAPRSRLYLRLNGHGAETVRLLGAMVTDDAVRTSGEWVVVTCPATEKARIVGALVEAGIHILDLRVDEATPGTDDAAPPRPERMRAVV